MTLVTFKADIYPYCGGDVVDLDEDQKTLVDETAELRGVNAPYVLGEVRDDGEEAARELTKAELIQEAENAGIEVPKRATLAQIKQLIEDNKADQEDDEE